MFSAPYVSIKDHEAKQALVGSFQVLLRSVSWQTMTKEVFVRKDSSVLAF